MKWIDLPPLWLVLFLVLAGGQARVAPLGAFPGWVHLAGTVVVGAAVVLFVAAGVEFLRHRTTIVPRERPSRLIDGGVFRLSRNPIYLADTLILLGLSMRWDSVLGIVLAPVLAAVIQARFIRGEESRLSELFGPDYAAYKARVRRWI